MSREPRPAYDIRGLEEDDLPLLAGWLAEPHWRDWWGPADEELRGIAEHIGSVSVEPLIVEFAGRPIAYAQTYDPHLEDGHPYADQPFGALGIDLSIGPADALEQGHGSAILDQLAATLFEEGAPRLLIDPAPSNTRAIRAYEKAGFRPLGERLSEYGHVLLMARDSGDGGDDA